MRQMAMFREGTDWDSVVLGQQQKELTNEQERKNLKEQIHTYRNMI